MSHRQHGKRPPKTKTPLEDLPLAEPCPTCGKMRHPNRKAAKAARARLRGVSMTVYRCGDYWHIGHTPRAVRLGEVGRADWTP